MHHCVDVLIDVGTVAQVTPNGARLAKLATTENGSLSTLSGGEKAFSSLVRDCVANSISRVRLS